MAVFVDLGEEDGEPPQDGKPQWHGIDALKPVPASAASLGVPGDGVTGIHGNALVKQHEEARGLAVEENHNQNSMTQALGCYP